MVDQRERQKALWQDMQNLANSSKDMTEFAQSQNTAELQYESKVNQNRGSD
jgi:hypothetical protein